MAQPYTRPQEGFRFKFGGLKTNAVPDAVGPTKYPLAVNVRGTLDNAVVTRPGQTQQFLAGADPITDFRAYSRINTNDRPRILARDAAGSVWLDTGVAAFTSGNPALVNSGASLIPFRPAQSPNPYMYIADATTVLSEVLAAIGARRGHRVERRHRRAADAACDRPRQLHLRHGVDADGERRDGGR